MVNFFNVFMSSGINGPDKRMLLALDCLFSEGVVDPSLDKTASSFRIDLKQLTESNPELYRILSGVSEESRERMRKVILLLAEEIQSSIAKESASKETGHSTEGSLLNWDIDGSEGMPDSDKDLESLVKEQYRYREQTKRSTFMGAITLQLPKKFAGHSFRTRYTEKHHLSRWHNIDDEGFVKADFGDYVNSPSTSFEIIRTEELPDTNLWSEEYGAEVHSNFRISRQKPCLVLLSEELSGKYVRLVYKSFDDPEWKTPWMLVSSENTAELTPKTQSVISKSTKKMQIKVQINGVDGVIKGYMTTSIGYSERSKTLYMPEDLENSEGMIVCTDQTDSQLKGKWVTLCSTSNGLRSVSEPRQIDENGKISFLPHEANIGRLEGKRVIITEDPLYLNETKEWSALYGSIYNDNKGIQLSKLGTKIRVVFLDQSGKTQSVYFLLSGLHLRTNPYDLDENGEAHISQREFDQIKSFLVGGGDLNVLSSKHLRAYKDMKVI
jgi:hypothetical protein